MNKRFGQLIDGIKAILIVAFILAAVALVVFLIPFIIGLIITGVVGVITYFILQELRESKPPPEDNE